eukprot:TRINITY_DN25173_c0_g2_i1.p1 TRINITY_DN25173_c0_g2~~TRINITY_DN25173_c0_g2_i1.p1  ORF type:complete len:522 (+),score=118.15 TRINITY_DN25173_c0_g2_i1:63-1628(+)
MAKSKVASEDVLTRDVLREELQNFSSTLMDPALQRLDADMKAVVAEAVAKALAESHAMDEARSAPPLIHPWLKQKPLRHSDLTAGASGENDGVQSKGVMQMVHHRHSQSMAGNLSARELAQLAQVDAYSPLTPREGADSPTASKGATFSSRLRSMVHSDLFEQSALTVLVLNAVLVGVETYKTELDALSKGIDRDINETFSLLESVFCIMFALEMTLRVWADGRDYFFSEAWKFNVFDLTVVCLVCFQQTTRVFRGSVGSSFNILRLLRLLRIPQLLRVVPMADEFQRMVASITSSLLSLFWVFVLLGGLIYFFSVYFTQMALAYGSPEHPDYQQLMNRFGTIHKSGLTLFEATFGGISWDEDAQLLLATTSPVTAFVLYFYVGFCQISLMNLITGVFVDKAMRAAAHAEEMQLCNTVADLFFHTNSHGQVSWEIFKEKLAHPDMQDYLKAVDINEGEAQHLFALLDTDNSGGIDVAELVNGLLRLKGSAGALEMSLLLREMAHICDRLEHRMCSRFQNQE